MKRIIAMAVSAACLSALSLTASAAEIKPEQQIKYRQSGYSFMAWNMKKIGAQVVDNTVPFNKEQVKAAADVIAAVANSGMGALYTKDSAANVGNMKTAVKPEFFQKPDEVKAIAIEFTKAANELAKVAAGGDAGAIKVAFGKVGESCKKCHDSFKQKD